MSKWQRVILTLLLIVEMAVTLLPMARGLLIDPPTGADFPPGGRVRPTIHEDDVPVGQPVGLRQGVLLGTTMMMLVTAASALAPVWLRPKARTWVATFTGTHVAAVGLGWVHDLPLLTLLAAVSAVGVPLLVLVPRRRGE